MTTASKAPSFFKVFFSDRSSERLQIPNAFVALTGLRKRVPEEFILRNGRGRDWKVKTSCLGDRVLFYDGWGRFVEENALKNEDFIVFQSDTGSSNLFQFRIFELSSWCEKPEVMVVEEEAEHENVMNMEIEEKEKEPEEKEKVYDCVMEEGEDKGDDHDDDEDDYEEEEDDDDDYEEEEEEDGDDDDEEEEYIVKDHPRVDKASDIRKKGTARGSGSKADDHLNEYGAIAEKYFFDRDNPYFVAKRIKDRRNELHIPYNIIKDFSLRLPKTITLWCQNIDISSEEQITTQKNRRTYTGELHRWKDGRVCIKGWSAFCRTNNIEATDTCICEIVLGEEARAEMLQVHVVRKQF